MAEVSQKCASSEGSNTGPWSIAVEVLIFFHGVVTVPYPFVQSVRGVQRGDGGTRGAMLAWRDIITRRRCIILPLVSVRHHSGEGIGDLGCYVAATAFTIARRDAVHMYSGVPLCSHIDIVGEDGSVGVQVKSPQAGTLTGPVKASGGPMVDRVAKQCASGLDVMLKSKDKRQGLVRNGNAILQRPDQL